MKRLFIVLPSVLLFAGCAASDQEAKVPHKKNRTVLSQSTVPVSHDENGNPFLQFDGERMGVDFDANLNDGENPTEFLMTKWKDQNGRIVVELDTVAPPTEQP